MKPRNCSTRDTLLAHTRTRQTSRPQILPGRLSGGRHDGVGRRVRRRSTPRLRQRVRGAVRLPLWELPQPVPEADHLQPVLALLHGRCRNDVFEIERSLYCDRGTRRRKPRRAPQTGKEVVVELDVEMKPYVPHTVGPLYTRAW